MLTFELVAYPLPGFLIETVFTEFEIVIVGAKCNICEAEPVILDPVKLKEDP